MIPMMHTPVTPLPVPAPGPVRFTFDEPLECVKGRVSLRGDLVPTENSPNYLSSGAIHTALKGKLDAPVTAGKEGEVLTMGADGVTVWSKSVSSIDVVERLPATGNVHNLYILAGTNQVYRWSPQDNQFVLVSPESSFATWLQSNVDSDGKIKTDSLQELDINDITGLQTALGEKYVKPADGIPATHLTTAVQSSLTKADSALQSETDPTVPEWAKQPTKPSYTASEVGTYDSDTIARMIERGESHYLTWKDDDGNFVQFSSYGTTTNPEKGTLVWAKLNHTEENPQFWYGAEPHTPDRTDYCTVADDETHGGGPTRYSFVGDWAEDGDFRFQYRIGTEMTVVELDAKTNQLYVMSNGVRTSEMMTSWKLLFELAKKGLVRLYYLANGSSEDTGRKALYTAHLVDDKAGTKPSILFDATGFIGTNQVWVRTITLTKEGDDGIHIAAGRLTELAKKSDVPEVTAPASDIALGKAADAKRTGEALAEKRDKSDLVYEQESDTFNLEPIFELEPTLNKNGVWILQSGEAVGGETVWMWGYAENSTPTARQLYFTSQAFTSEAEARSAKTITIVASLFASLRGKTVSKTVEKRIALTSDIPEVVVPASDVSTGKAADAKSIWDKLGAFWDKIVANRDNGSLLLNSNSRTDVVPYETQLVNYPFSAYARISYNGKLYINRKAFRKTTSGWDSDKVTGQIYEPGATGFASFAHGFDTSATASQSHAEGYQTEASGEDSHAEGVSCHAVGRGSHAEGSVSYAVGDYSHAEGTRSVTAEFLDEFGNASNPHRWSYVWNGGDLTEGNGYYHSHGHYTFNINPGATVKDDTVVPSVFQKLTGFFIGAKHLYGWIKDFFTANVVAPTTSDAGSGKAADAKLTGEALAGKASSTHTHNGSSVVLETDDEAGGHEGQDTPTLSEVVKTRNRALDFYRRINTTHGISFSEVAYMGYVRSTNNVIIQNYETGGDLIIPFNRVSFGNDKTLALTDDVETKVDKAKKFSFTNGEGDFELVIIGKYADGNVIGFHNGRQVDVSYSAFPPGSHTWYLGGYTEEYMCVADSEGGPIRYDGGTIETSDPFNVADGLTEDAVDRLMLKVEAHFDNADVIAYGGVN